MIQIEKQSDGVVLHDGRSRTRIRVIHESIIRVTHTAAAEFSTRPSIMVQPQPQRPAGFTIIEHNERITLRTFRTQVEIDRQTGRLSFRDLNKALLLREGARQLKPIAVEKRIFDESIKIEAEHTTDGVKARVAGAKVVVDRQAFSATLNLEFQPDEMIFGLGQHEEGILNYRGHCQYLYQQNMKVAMPLIVSSRGYGVLFDTNSLATFCDDERGSFFWTEIVDELDYYFLAGPDFDRIISMLRLLTGAPTMFPRWAFGYIQSKERYRTQQELIDVVREYRRRKIPLDCIVQDWCTWTGKQWGNKQPDPERYPDPTTLVNDLHALNCKLMVSIWPIMRGECADQIEMREQKFLLGNDATYDAFNPAARALYWKQANEGWFRHGVDAWWCDCTEPFEADWKGAVKPDPQERMRINTNESKTFLDPQYINAYSMLHSQGIYEHQRAATNDKRVVNLTRSGFPGQQRYGAITWSGDIAATWDTLRRQIADGLNFCVTGNPRWTLDIGAFFVDRKEQWFWRGDYPGGCDDPGYRELYGRWMQLGAFLPMMRSHGTDTPREVWRFGNPGEEAYDAIVDAIRLRYRLLPYIYSLAAWETRFGYTMMRMLAFDFREDLAACGVADQFMFGPALLVCPVTQPGAGSRRVYLPRGSGWFDFWTGVQHGGGKTIVADAPLRRLPLFVRAGSILPLGPHVQHSGASLDASIELRVYRGGDAAFSLYEDEGDNYNCEHGEFSITPIAWSQADARLSLGPGAGTFRNMPAERTFNVVLVNRGDGGIEPIDRVDRTLTVKRGAIAEASWK